MAKITIINDDSENHSGEFDLIFTDPPFDISAEKLATIINGFSCNHWFCIANMHLIAKIARYMPEWEIKWDVVFDMSGPKKKANLIQPNFTHYNGIYLVKNNAKTIFNRKAGQRTDVFANHYYPTIFKAPRMNDLSDHSQAKNTDALTNVLRGFDVKNFIDPFAGSLSAGIAAVDVDIDCTLIELDKHHCDQGERTLKMLGAKIKRLK